MRSLLVLGCLFGALLISRAVFIEDELVYGNFPPNFIWGAATSAGQVEGAWNVDGINSTSINKHMNPFISLCFLKGRGPSIWDTFVRIPGNVADGSTPDDACKSYQYYQQDVNLLKNMGVI